MRNVLLENKLCDAIKRHQVIRLRYKGQLYSRTFEPYIIYRSTKDNILLGGTQTKDDSQPLKPATPHNFEIELITALTVTDATFKYDERFDPTADIYRNGILCVINRVKVSD
jgi:hypothetical protein